MREALHFYINGQWVSPSGAERRTVENPATERPCGTVALGTAADIDHAASAAHAAFPLWAASTRADRLALLEAIAAEYARRTDDLAAAVTEEMGAPASLARGPQVGLGALHLATTLEILRDFPFEEQRGATLIRREPVGVCGLITPWNWPLNQIAVKVFPALATGCTMVLKPSEITPFSAQIFAEILHAAGVPAGVFNIVQGDGPGAGAPLAAHPLVDMVSFTGSTRAGVEVARLAAPTVKRVAQELGGKSANIILDDEKLAEHVRRGVASVMGNSGQTCSAPTRMFVPVRRMDEALAVAREAAEQTSVGDPAGNHAMGPVASAAQFEKVQGLIASGLAEGARLVAGGPGRPDGLATGYFVKPTVFADVTPDMTIAREEIFGPVLCIIGYADIAEAIAAANATPYGLAGYVSGADLESARMVARQLRAGSVSINGGFDPHAPFGGYKQSGNGREWGEFGFHDYVEIKAIQGYAPAAKA